MRFRLVGGGLVEFTAAAVVRLTARRQVGPAAPEAGGVLLGRQILGSSDVVIDHASEPSLKDRRGRFWFRRARQPAQEIVDRAWRESGGVVNYLGEWHTHPEDDPSPSWVDKYNWWKIARRVSVDSEYLLFAIVGIKYVRVWQVNRADRKVHQLEYERTLDRSPLVGPPPNTAHLANLYPTQD